MEKFKKNYKKSNKFNISALIWNKDFELPDGSYFLSNIQIFLSISSKSMNKWVIILQQEYTGQIRNDGTEDIEIMAPLKYLSNFWRTLEMPLISCEINLQLKSYENSFLVSGTAAN